MKERELKAMSENEERIKSKFKGNMHKKVKIALKIESKRN